MIEVSRDEFEARTGYLVNETLDIVERAMASAQAKSPDIAYDEVLLVGGACRMPMIEAALKARFGWSAVTKTEFDLAVAKGAAIYGQGSSFAEPEPAPVPGPSGGDDAAQKTFFVPGSDERKTISGVLPKGIGIKLVRDTPMGGSPEEYVGFLAHAQASLPDEFPMMVHTYSANTTVLTIHVFEQGGGRESELLEDNREITPETGATFVDLPSLPKGSPIDVNLRIDAEGLGTLSAVEPQSGQKLTLRVKLAVMQAEEQGEATRIVDGMVRGN
jgi:molecular chaperone DnaK (HSP70)